MGDLNCLIYKRTILLSPWIKSSIDGLTRPRRPGREWILGASDWRAVLLDPLKEPLQVPHIPLSICVTLQYWTQLCGTGYAESGYTHVPIPLSFLSLRIPDIQIDSWRDKGILYLESLYDGASLQPFATLQAKYGLPSMHHFKYAQITHLKSQLFKQQAIPSRIMTLLSCYPQLVTKGSKLYYNLATHNDVFSKTPNIIKWETDLGQQFSSLQWQKAIRWAHKSSSCANRREQFHRLLTRGYYTPLRLAKAFSTVSPYCWRSCGSTGSILHIYWSCPHLKPSGTVLRALSPK